MKAIKICTAGRSPSRMRNSKGSNLKRKFRRGLMVIRTRKNLVRCNFYRCLLFLLRKAKPRRRKSESKRIVSGVGRLKSKKCLRALKKTRMNWRRMTLSRVRVSIWRVKKKKKSQNFQARTPFFQRRTKVKERCQIKG